MKEGCPINTATGTSSVVLARPRQTGDQTDLHPDRTVLIGDTPQDVIAGRHGGVRAIATASGKSSARRTVPGGDVQDLVVGRPLLRLRPHDAASCWRRVRAKDAAASSSSRLADIGNVLAGIVAFGASDIR
ncbi:HAD hydrolase-like protein [Nonomuraea guangzhouensis]|uniref:HAD hydrolase-like protein n=1 Tax=Nonomuraea guangzhouensis TaxID=1291555 RepID=UPI00355819D0